MSPAVSVVIPFRDVTEYLPAALASIAAQTFSDLEVLLVDDGSSVPYDPPPAGGLPVRTFRREPAGVSAARNFGAREARGRWLAFLDADDTTHPTRLARQLAQLEAAPRAVLAYGNLTFVDAHGAPLGKDLKVQHGLARLPDGDCRAALTRRSFVMPSSLLIRRELYLELGGFDEKLSYAEDWDFAVRAAQAGPFVADQEPLGLYRRHGACVTLQGKRQAHRDLVVERVLALVPESERASARAYLAGQDRAENAFLALGQRRLFSAARELAAAFVTSPAAASHVLGARVASFSARARRGRPR